MPLYDFKCEGCGQVFEDLCKVDDKNPPCSICGKDSERLMSGEFNRSYGGSNDCDKFHDNWSYRLGVNLDAGRDLRRRADAKHGPSPYPS